MGKQKLSPKAAKAKKERDLRYANTRDREIKRADSAKRRRAAKKKGQNVNGKDFDHHTGRFVSASRNRAGMHKNGGGTKNEKNGGRCKTRKKSCGCSAKKKLGLKK